MRITVTGDKEELRPVLEQFCKDLEDQYAKEKEKWEKRLNRNPIRWGKVEMPEMVFSVLDHPDNDTDLVFFHSMPTPMLHKILRIPIRRMEQMLEGYCKSKGIECKSKWTGD
jgi:hypothetical protein